MSVRTDFESCFRDPETQLMFTQLDRETLQPTTDDFFLGSAPPAEEGVEGFSRAEVEMHENFGIVTGSYMASEALRYERTGAPDALESMHRSLCGLRWVYETGKQLAPGYFPKVYGRRFSQETSTDQVLYACLGMEAYHPFADAVDKRLIEEMIPQMVRFWMERDYRYHYFKYCGPEWQWPLLRFPPLLKLAEHFSGDSLFTKEYRRLLAQTALPEHCQLLFQLRGAVPTDYEKANHGWLNISGADRIGMDTMQFDLLLRHDPDNPLAYYWKAGIRWMWEEVRDSLTEDGFYYSQTIHDFDTLQTRRTPGWSADGTDIHGAKSAWSTWVTRAGLIAQRHCPELRGEVMAAAQNVLKKLTFMTCFYYTEPERFPPEKRFQTRFLSGDAVANYLWTQELLGKEQHRQ